MCLDIFPGCVERKRSKATMESAGLEAGVYFIINRWRADQGESRAGQYVGFIGHDVQLEATPVGWQLVPAGKPNRFFVRNMWRPGEDSRYGLHLGFRSRDLKLEDCAVPWEITPVEGRSDRWCMRNYWREGDDDRSGEFVSFSGQQLKLCCCGTSFKNKESLKSHIRKKHPRSTGSLESESYHVSD